MCLANDVIIVCHDMFDNYFERLSYFQTLVYTHKNLKIVLFNLPGNGTSTLLLPASTIDKVTSSKHV